MNSKELWNKCLSTTWGPHAGRELCRKIFINSHLKDFELLPDWDPLYATLSALSIAKIYRVIWFGLDFNLKIFTLQEMNFFLFLFEFD